MTRPDIEATLTATYRALLAEAVAVVLAIAICAAWIAIGAV